MNNAASIITCVYNRQLFLAQTIESVLNQTWTDFEYLIWDDGSSDRSLEIAQNYARQNARIRVIAAPHQGLVHSLRSAIAETTGACLSRLGR